MLAGKDASGTGSSLVEVGDRQVNKHPWFGHTEVKTGAEDPILPGGGP